VKLVQLKRLVGDEDADVLATVGPMEDADADGYASRLLDLVQQRAGLGLSVGTTPVESTSGTAAEPPAGPAELLAAVLARAEGTGEGTGEARRGLPGSDPRA
jgi:hypothetical protein